MDKKSYLDRFSKLVRWRLPADEAEDVISDYTELLAAHPEDETALVKTFGDPALAAKVLGITREYLCWMIVLAILCINFSYFLLATFGVYSYAYYQFDVDKILFYFSIGLIAFWKWKSPKGSQRKCPGLLPAVLGMLIPAAALGALLIFFYIICLKSINGDYSGFGGWIAPLFSVVLRLTGSVSWIAAIAGLICSRMRDRRWLVITAMAVTILFCCMQSMLLMFSLDSGEAALRALKCYVPFLVVGTAGVIWTVW